MKTKNADITFVYLPPSVVSIPSPAFSVLKSHLHGCGIQSKIIYLNHLLEKDSDFFKQELVSNTESLLPFLRIINKNDTEKSKYISTYYQCLFPDMFLTERSYRHEILQDIENVYNNVIDNAIKEIIENKSKIIGFSSKFNQWIPAIVIADKIKNALPDVLIVIGGWTNSQAAIDFLSLNKNIDFCIWGEGEIPIEKLMCHILHGEHQFPIEEIPRLIYRKNNNIIKNKGGNSNTYIDLNLSKNTPDFSDYFESINKLGIKHYFLPIERGRGCNWNKCNFCYLAQGYKFRMKHSNVIIDEIETLINQYKCHKVFFTDNDIIGSNVANFDLFLDGLILIKKKYPDFAIIMAEVISKGVDKEIIKKMHQAGFRNIQIGLETLSESLMKDINKKQSINDNFFFIKNAIQNGIIIKGANIIIETPNETDSMIIQSINNLHNYRFLLNKPDFDFNIIPLSVSNFSNYLGEIKKSKKDSVWSVAELAQIIPKTYYTDIDRFSLINYLVDTAEKPLWNLFQKALTFYKRKKFRYQIELNNLQKTIHYTEYTDNDLIKDIEINDEIHWNILHLLNDSIYQTDDLYLKVQEISNKIKRKAFNQKLNELQNEDIIFIDQLDNSIVSIININ